MNTVYDIKVIEYPIVVKDSNDESWKTVPEFNITVKTNQYTLYVIRYIPDLLSFNHLVKLHYPKIKIPFPTLTESLSKLEKRKSIRNFFHISIKTNAEKVEKYLLRCIMDDILKYSTLLRDFFSPQREGDMKTDIYPSPSQSYDSLRPTTNDDKSELVWVPSPHSSIVNLSNYEQEEEAESDDLLIDILKKESQHPMEFEFPLDNLEMIKVLGKGCMGKVLLVKSKKTKEIYALKSIVKEHVIEQREISHTLDERNILAKLSELNHPYLAKLHTSFQDEHRLYLLTNYYSGGDLATHMAKLYSFSKECALFYAAEIIDGIGELHKLGILYRDLKPENILLTGDGHIILTDFGLSKWLIEKDNFTTQTFCGTAEYLAPEVLLGESYSFGIDHWSFGTILYEMLAGITPFWADNHADMYRRVLEDPLEFPADIFDYETAEFLSDILDRDPRTRLGVNDINDIKNHVYFQNICWNDIRNRNIQPPFIPPVNNNTSDELDFTNFDPDFLTMTPQLTPISSQIDFNIDDIFDGYSFTNDHYIEFEQQQKIYQRQSYHEDGFYSARKRGSISMLSNSSQSFISKSNLEDHKRYAKRRNTSTSEDHHTLPVEQLTNTLNNTLDVNTFDDFSKLPDLRLSFNIDRTLTPPSNKSSHQSKTRRFFSLLL